MAEARSLKTSTVVDRLIEHLRARSVVLDGQEAPAAVLWTDPKAELRSLIEVLQARLGELLVHGDYKSETRTGPAIWIRCLVDGALAEPALPEGRVPIIYLPGVARQDLSAGESAGRRLSPS